MKKVKRISAIIIAVIFLSSFFAIPVNAVDPISATAIANGFAQAITAYGAANGVSLTFDNVDSSSTDQIGEAVHDLWSRFRADQQTADDYLAIGEALMPSLFYKAEKAAGTAAIGISIAQEYMPDIDAFWNWVLSGPAEMVKVDNEYQWNVVDNNISTPTVAKYSNTIGFQPIHYSSDPPADASSWAACEPTMYANTNDLRRFYIVGEKPIYYVLVGNNILCQIAPLAFTGSKAGTMSYYPNQGTYSVYSSYVNGANTDSTTGYKFVNSSLSLWSYIYPLPHYASVADACATIYGVRNGVDVSVTVAPYVGDAVAKPVPIPDTTDPDYGPIPWTGDLDIPWNDTLFGDGTGTLTNEQTSDIVGTIDDAIVQNPDKTIELDTETDVPINPDLPAPSEIIIPFLPVEVPSFNFSLSGIWHYVREWVSSLGAWFALVFTVWSYLPYALVVPVYASAVIVIVLGVYKRFFM